MRAVLALDGEDYKKHSAVISRFSLRYLKSEILPHEYGALITNASLIRNRSDYEDFFICSIDETKRLVDGASKFLSIIKIYLEGQYLQLDHLQDVQNAIVDENMNADE